MLDARTLARARRNGLEPALRLAMLLATMAAPLAACGGAQAPPTPPAGRAAAPAAEVPARAAATVVEASGDPGLAFPSADDVTRIGRDATGPTSFKVGEAVDRWQLEGPFPAVTGATPTETANDLERELAMLLPTDGSVTLSEQARCLAREWGRFELEHGGPPAPTLKALIGARCGVAKLDASVFSTGWQGARTVSDARILEAWRGGSEQVRVFAAPDGTPTTIGAWLGRRDDTAAVYVVRVRTQSALDPVTIETGGSADVAVSGRLPRGYERVQAISTVSALDARACTRDDDVDEPRFRFVCRIDPNLPQASIQVVGWQRRALLGHEFARVMVVPTGRGEVIELPAVTTPETGRFDDDFVAAVNEVRVAAGRRPLTLSRGQSATATNLARVWFDDAEPRDAAAAARAGEGMMAGWQVEQPIVGAAFEALTVGATATGVAAARQFLANPSARSALLAPASDLIALGSIEAPGGRGVMAGVYTSFDANTPRMPTAEGVIARLAALRSERGLPAPQAANESLRAAVAAVPAVVTGAKVAPIEALRQVVDSVMLSSEGPVQFAVLAISDVGDLALQNGLDASSLRIAAAVIPWRGPNEPWVRYHVALVFETATLALPARDGASPGSHPGPVVQP
jgi:hypothetical protein